MPTSSQTVFARRYSSSASKAVTKTTESDSVARFPPRSPRAKIHIDLDEYNITHAHQKITAMFLREHRNIPALQKELARALWIAENGVHETDQKTANKKIVSLRRNLRDQEGS